MHKFAKGQRFTVKSGNVYQITGLCTYEHPCLKGEAGYHTIQIKNGKPYGPMKLTRESKISVTDPDWNIVGGVRILGL